MLRSMISFMERVTATIDPETLAEIKRIAGPRGVSSFLQLAATERLARLRVLGLLDELDDKFGAPSEQIRNAVDTDARRVFSRGRRR